MQFLKYYSGFARKVKYFFYYFNKKVHNSVMDKPGKSCYDIRDVKKEMNL